MKKILIGFLLILNFGAINIASADPYVPGLNSPTGVAGSGTAIPAAAEPSPSASPGPSSAGTPPSNSTPVGSGPGPDIYSVTLQEPLDGQPATLTALNGVDLINQYLSMIYMWAAGIVGLVAVLMIVASGIQIIFGGASPELVSDAKTRVFQALLSLVLLFGTALLLKTLNPTFFAYY